ncbi:hypothetical protein N665_0218s0044 [Sinapis alba]|nr:hypothetical protein N665_0218s0044 [Sinapis alba]
MVCEDYNTISEIKVVEFAYMLPKRILEQMPSNTPLMFLSNDIQLANFVIFSNTYVMCIYVSLTENKGRHDVNRNQKRVVKWNVAADFEMFSTRL